MRIHLPLISLKQYNVMKNTNSSNALLAKRVISSRSTTRIKKSDNPKMNNTGGTHTWGVSY